MTKTIFITGGGSGIGRAVAQRFAREGWRVGIGDVSEAGMAETLASLPAGADPDMARSWRLDVRDKAQWKDVMRELGEWTGGTLDILHNNAGVTGGGPIAETSDADIDLVIDVNLKGVVYGIRAALPLLEATPGAVILNTSSASGYYGSPGLVTYSATKFGVRALTEGLDVELAPLGIKVRAILPSFIDTPLLEANIPGSNRSARDSVVAAKLEFTPVEEVAEAAWKVVHGDKVHVPVGKTAKRLALFSRFAPGLLRKQLRPLGGGRKPGKAD